MKLCKEGNQPSCLFFVVDVVVACQYLFCYRIYQARHNFVYFIDFCSVVFFLIRKKLTLSLKRQNQLELNLLSPDIYSYIE